MPKWADVSKGDRVELNGRTFDVVKIKRDGKRADVTLETRGRKSKGRVKLSDKVTVVDRRAALHDARGAQTRWASKGELRERLGLPAGDAAQARPPARAKGDPWETQGDRIERRLDDLLQARLVAETPDESAGYYVPPVDVSTVASHLALFHGGIPAACDDEAKMLAAHDVQHSLALRGSPLAVNHWHSARRP